jgi:hypothetical protein
MFGWASETCIQSLETFQNVKIILFEKLVSEINFYKRTAVSNIFSKGNKIRDTH